MNQKKIGQFIAQCRKEKNLTQMQLAEKLHITNRAISKWETGKSLPDASIMLDLCKLLDITTTELLTGEQIAPEQVREQAEITLLELLNTDKKLKSQKFLSEMLGGGGTGIILSILYAPDTTIKSITAVIGFVMVCCGWYFRAKLEKNKFSYPACDKQSVR